jgi:hypothetical protein
LQGDARGAKPGRNFACEAGRLTAVAVQANRIRAQRNRLA